jgi:hypothetical protein
MKELQQYKKYNFIYLKLKGGGDCICKNNGTGDCHCYKNKLKSEIDIVNNSNINKNKKKILNLNTAIFRYPVPEKISPVENYGVYLKRKYNNMQLNPIIHSTPFSNGSKLFSILFYFKDDVLFDDYEYVKYQYSYNKHYKENHNNYEFNDNFRFNFNFHLTLTQLYIDYYSNSNYYLSYCFEYFINKYILDDLQIFYDKILNINTEYDNIELLNKHFVAVLKKNMILYSAVTILNDTIQDKLKDRIRDKDSGILYDIESMKNCDNDYQYMQPNNNQYMQHNNNQYNGPPQFSKTISSNEETYDLSNPQNKFLVNQRSDILGNTNTYFGTTVYNTDYDTWKPHISIIKKMSEDNTADKITFNYLNNEFINRGNNNIKLCDKLLKIKIMYGEKKYEIVSINGKLRKSY